MPWPRGRALAALAAILGVATLLRVVRLGHGLPHVLDEDYPFRVALGMWNWRTGAIDWNPHFFIYPSLTIYLHLLLQKAAVAIGTLTGRFAGPADYRLAFETDPTPMVLLARGFDVACDLVMVVGVARLAERLRRGAGLWAALLAALSPLLILTARGIHCDTQLTALSVWSLERLVAWRGRGHGQGGSGRATLAAAVVLAGLAAGAKYPGGMLVIPIAWAIVERDGAAMNTWSGAPRAWWRAALAAAGALAVFLATSPFVVLDFAGFRRHFEHQTEHMALGHLGHIGGTSFGFDLQTLAGNLGWAGVATLALGLLLAVPAFAPDAAFARGARLAWAFVLPLGLAFGFAQTPMDRYVSPLVGVGAALATATVMAAADLMLALIAWTTVRPSHAEIRVPRAAAALGIAAMLLPVGWSGVLAGWSGGGSTQAEAAAWFGEHLAPGELVVQEGYGAPLMTREQRGAVLQSDYFAAAGAEARRRFLARPAYHAVNVPLYVEGRPMIPVRAPSGAVAEVELFPFASDFCRVYYDPRLYAGVDYVVTTGAVRGRFAADPKRFAEQAAFYAFLDREAEPVAHFVSHDQTIGPEVNIYRLGPRAQRALTDAGALPPLWWADMIPLDYRRAADRVATGDAATSGGAVHSADGALAPWVRSLSGVYGARIAPFARNMASEQGLVGHIPQAEHLASASLAITPDDQEAFRLYVNCVFRRQPAPAAKATVESTLKALEREDARAVALRETYDRMLETLDPSGFDNN
ncbi:MAG: hypothetical protein HYR74_05245 [Candidatus Eisenbacteria bacterium]|nr:hypothetical protein [Candidatus Eisenbacteria bacterium]